MTKQVLFLAGRYPYKNMESVPRERRAFMKSVLDQLAKTPPRWTARQTTSRRPGKSSRLLHVACGMVRPLKKSDLTREHRRAAALDALVGIALIAGDVSRSGFELSDRFGCQRGSQLRDLPILHERHASTLNGLDALLPQNVR
jgi:hypothetical protein